MSKVSSPAVKVATARRKPVASARSLPGSADRLHRVTRVPDRPPLVRLQVLAFSHGARAYSQAFSEPGIWQVIWRTVELALGSLAIALVLGTALAWAASTLSPRLRFLKILPILPIVVPAIASVLGWSFLFSPHPGYLNALLRHLPWWHHLTKAPSTSTRCRGSSSSPALRSPRSSICSSAPASRTSTESCSRGAGLRILAGRRVLPRHAPAPRPALIYGSGVALLLALGQFTAADPRATTTSPC